MNKKLQIAVIGSAGPEEYPGKKPNKIMFEAAYLLGQLLAEKNCIVVNGGKGGIMEAVSRGAKDKNGTTVAEISGSTRYHSNPYIDIEIVSSDIGYRGPSLLIGMSDAVIALGGGAGTLQEIAVAYRMKKPTVLLTGFGGWVDRLKSLEYLDERQLIAFSTTTDIESAVIKALEMVK